MVSVLLAEEAVSMTLHLGLPLIKIQAISVRSMVVPGFTFTLKWNKLIQVTFWVLSRNRLYPFFKLMIWFVIRILLGSVFMSCVSRRYTSIKAAELLLFLIQAWYCQEQDSARKMVNMIRAVRIFFKDRIFKKVLFPFKAVKYLVVRYCGVSVKIMKLWRRF